MRITIIFKDMKYVIIYNENKISFADAVEDNTIVYYPNEGYYCKVFDSEEKFLNYKQVIEEALIQKRIDVECVSCYREWLDKMNVNYPITAERSVYKQLIIDNITNSNYPLDKNNWIPINKIFEK